MKMTAAVVTNVVSRMMTRNNPVAEILAPKIINTLERGGDVTERMVIIRLNYWYMGFRFYIDAFGPLVRGKGS